MSEGRKSYLKSSLFLVLAIISFSAYSQENKSNPERDLISSDTADYIPVWYAGGLEYNLLIASAKGYVSEIDRLIKKGANINSYTEEGVTPLIIAAVSNKVSSVKALLKYSPKLDEFTNRWETALMIAVKNDFEEVAETLLRAGADVDFTDNYGASPLHYAVLYGYFQMADMLLYYDASVDSKSDEGYTPLHTAILAGNSDIADMLIQNNANLEARDNDGDTPFLIAATTGDTLMMEMLRSFGVDIFAKNKYGHNALTIATAYGYKDEVKYLLSLSNKWKEPVNTGVNPFRVASEYGRREIAALLASHDIPGKITHSPDYITVSGSARFTPHDFYSGLSISVKDPYSNFGLIIGLDKKLWYTRIIQKSENDTYYQYFDKSSLLYGGLFREFNFTSKADRSNISFITSLSGGYAFGNKFRGTDILPDNGFKIMPGLTLRWTNGPVSVFLGGEYIKYDYYKVGPVWIRAGMSWNYSRENTKVKVKKIKWG